MSEVAIGVRTGGGRLVAAVVVALMVLMLSPGQAQASEDGAGTFIGWEYPPATSEQDPPPTLCGTFDPNEPYPGETDPSGPLRHVIEMDGTFHGVPDLNGTAEFTYDQIYSANPEGTYTDDNCQNPGALVGTMTINSGGFSCSGTGTYERRGTSVYTLDFDGTCDNGGGSTTVSFTGAQEPCPCPPAPEPDPGSWMEGTYIQTN